MTAEPSLRAVLFDFDGTLWDSETAVFGVFRELFAEYGDELTLQTWSAAIGTVGGFDPYAALNRLHDGRLDIEVTRASTEERISEAAGVNSAAGSLSRFQTMTRIERATRPARFRCDPGSPGSSASWTGPASGERS